VRVVDFERMPCSRRDAHGLRVRGRDDGVFALEGEDVAPAMSCVRRWIYAASMNFFCWRVVERDGENSREKE
jgi:hypothetical protein